MGPGAKALGFLKMAERLLSVDPLTGISTFHDYDEDTDQTIIRYAGDCEPVLEANKVLQNDPDVTKRGIKDGMWLYARIPAIWQTKLLIEHGIDVWNKEHAERLNRILEDPAYRHLKTTTKHHKFK